MKYVAVIERAEDGSYSAYVPDLPGCVACGDTVKEARELIEGAITPHVASLRRHGDPVPPPVTQACVVDAA